MKKFKLFKKEEHTITLIAEFAKNNQSLKLIADLSGYVHSIANSAFVLTDLQAHQAGYRIIYKISYTKSLFHRHNYTADLADLSNWLFRDNSASLFRYHYNYV